MLGIRNAVTTISFLLLVFAMAGCVQKNDSQQAAAAADTKPAPAAEPEQQAGDDAASELAGTSWRLVKIMGMDDSVDEPEDRFLDHVECRGFQRLDESL